MKKYKVNLQLFGDGGAEAAAEGEAGNGSVGAEGKAEEALAKPAKVVYGKQDPSQESRMPELDQDATNKALAERSAAFETMIKGEYKDEFNNRVQKIMDKRFRNMDAMKTQLGAQQPIMEMLAQKYGVDASDGKALLKAIEDDDTLYEEEALDRGLTVSQLKEIKRLERDNAMLSDQIREQENQANAEKDLARWIDEAEQFKEDYGIEIDLRTESQNGDFLALLMNGFSVEDAYMAIHHKEVMSTAVATTAAMTKQKVAQNIAARSSRPAENGLLSQPATVVKNDVSKLTKEDRDEIARRVEAGEIISF